MSDALLEFVKGCSQVGKSHRDIRLVLKDAGWADEQVEGVLSRFVDRDFPVAIPKAEVYASPRLVFLNLFYFLALYLACYHVVGMLFTFLDYHLPDGLGRMQGTFYRSYRPAGESIRWYLGSLLVEVPLVWWMSWRIRRAMSETGQGIPKIRLKLLYLTLFIGGCVMLGNATYFVYFFLGGELGVRFVIKALILSVLVLWLFAFYRIELKRSSLPV